MRELSELPTGRYQLPNISKDVALFKGAVFNEAELAEQLNGSKSLSRLYQRSELDSMAKRPLLPLNLGQVGLVGGSGMINGLVECDTPHIIKGRIVKEKRVRSEDNVNSKGDLMSTTLFEVVSNKLIFNVLTPKGFVSLTDYGSGPVEAEDGEESGFRNGSRNYDKGAQNFNSNIHYSGENLLPLGRTVITTGASEVLSDYDVASALIRHQSYDWGDVSDADKKANYNAVKDGERILSSYRSAEGEKFWVITEWDRSATTVLLPDEY